VDSINSEQPNPDQSPKQPSASPDAVAGLPESSPAGSPHEAATSGPVEQNPPPQQPPETGLTPTIGDQVLAAILGLTEAVNRVALKLDAVRLELRQTNVLETEKMRFNQFMDSMRSSYTRLVKKVEKRLKNVGKPPEQTDPTK
jgi:hypothetical protein